MNQRLRSSRTVSAVSSAQDFGGNHIDPIHCHTLAGGTPILALDMGAGPSHGPWEAIRRNSSAIDAAITSPVHSSQPAH